MKRAWKTRVCLLVVLCMAALFLPQSLAAQEQQPGSPTDDQPETVSPAAVAAPLQRNASSTTLAYDPAVYSENDVNVINAMIENNGLEAKKDDPAGWDSNDLVDWSAGSPKRITGLGLNNKALSGNLDVRGLTGLEVLGCYGNQLTGLNVSGLTSLFILECGGNNIASLDLRGLSAISVDCNVTKLIDPLGKTMTCNETEEGFAQILQYNQNGSKEVQIQAYPKVGYTFQKWDNETTDNPYTFELNSGMTRIPVFIAEAEPRYNQEDLAALEKFIADYQLDGYGGIRLGYPDTYIDIAQWEDDDTARTGKRLIGLSIGSKKLTGSMEVTGFPALTFVFCSSNKLTSLTVSDLPNLLGLNCNDNQLTSLEMNNLPAFTGLECAYNQLTSLDVSGLNQLILLDCDNNPLSSLKLPEEKSIQINVTQGKGRPWLADFDYHSGAPNGRYTAEGAPGYGNPAWDHTVGCTDGGDELTFNFGNNEGVSAVSANLTFERTEALEADPEKGKIEGKGVAPGDNVKQGDTFTFTANPITTGEGEAFPGDTQYMPESWSVNPSGDFTTGPTQSFSTKDMALGKHTLTVEYRKEWYDGRNWVYADEKIQKTFDFTLVEKSTSGGNTTGGGQTVSQPGTNTDVSSGNPGTGDPLAVGWLVVAGMSALGAGVMLRKQQKKA